MASASPLGGEHCEGEMGIKAPHAPTLKTPAGTLSANATEMLGGPIVALHHANACAA
jgi:hypothetical protein